MLKIKDNVDLQELKKFGLGDNKFELKNSFKSYILEVWWNELPDDYCSHILVEINTDTRIIESYYCDESIVLDVVYDLIKAGLVEKVEDK